MKPSARIGAALTALSIALALAFVYLPAGAAQSKADPASPGELTILTKEGKAGGVCPLKHTDVDAQISGFIARVNVVQEFSNPTQEKIEAVYTFPLPEDSAVDRMRMKVGERTIAGEIHRREEARQIYEAAREAGHVASLLDQERPNIFTQSVANILPGEKVVITISYTQLLKYDAGEYRFVFPMVVGPRYIPGTPTGKSGTGSKYDTTSVPDASKISPPLTPKGTRAGHDISLNVEIHAGIPISEANCDTHDIDCEFPDQNSAKISLRDKNTIPNKDFVLRYNVAGEMVHSGVITHAPGKGGYFTLLFQPPKTPNPKYVTPKEMIFVIDTSGSQQGEPLAKSKETMLHCIKNVNPGDTFNMIAFSNGVSKLFESPRPYNRENLDAAVDFLKKCESGGGTEMLPAVKAALEPPADPQRLRLVVFFTDGFIGNDFEVLDCIKKSGRSARVFPFGIGGSVNRFLIEKMADLGRGAPEVVLLDSDSASVARKFYERIRNPLITDISVDWNGLPVTAEDVYPSRINDLFSSQPLIVKGRYSGPASGEIIVRGKVAGKPWARRVAVDFPASQDENDSLASIWARAKVDDLMDQDLMGAQTGKPQPNIQEKIVNLALEYSLMTQYTSFVAVETMVITDGGAPKTIAVPVEMPEGVSYEGIPGEDKSPASAGVLIKARKAGRSLAGQATGGSYGANNNWAASSPAPATSRDELYFAVDSTVTAVNEKDPEQLKKQAALQKLDRLLTELIGKFEKSGESGDYSVPGKLVVKDGRVEVLIWLKDATQEKVAQLEKLGLAHSTWAIKDRVLIGWVPLAKLEEAARLEFVKRLAAPTYINKK